MPFGMARRCCQNLISAWKSCTEGESLVDGSESMWEVKVRLGELCTQRSSDVLKRRHSCYLCARAKNRETCNWKMLMVCGGMLDIFLKKEYFRRLCLSCLFCFWSSCCWHRWFCCSQWQRYVWISWLDIAKCICSGWAGSCVFWTGWLCYTGRINDWLCSWTSPSKDSV